MKKLVVLVVLSVVAAALASLGACTTDQPKVDDSGSAALTDGASSQPSDAGTSTTAASDGGTAGPAADGGPILGRGDGGPEESGAGSGSTGSTTTDPDVKPTGTPDGTKPDGTKPDGPKQPDVPAGGGKTSPFDKILAKPKAQPFDVDALKALVEKKTGLKVVNARKSAGKWVLFQFAPTSGGRTEQEQAKLVSTLQEMSEFTNVEGDKLMKLK